MVNPRSSVRIRGPATLNLCPLTTITSRVAAAAAAHPLYSEMLGKVNLHLQAKGVRITTGAIVDATIIHAPNSTKNREGERDPKMRQTRNGKQW
ncbi:MAG: hypothetical protein ACM3JB_25605 [Acidobacteriaceae bacterium]